MELAGAIKDEFLTCNICLEDYHHPKQLPCLHTFCRHCLSHYISQTVGQSGVLSVRCPICRRISVPSDPDPRKLHQWADQYPDNFFVVSLKETLEARKEERQTDSVASGSSADQSTRYFMGEANTCSRHPAQHLTRYCQVVNIGVCDTCLTEDPHSACKEENHLPAEEARNAATELLEKYGQNIDQMKQEVTVVRQSFSRRPRLLGTKKDEVEIGITEYFSALRSSCAKFLLAKEREMVESLNNIIQDESGRTGDAQRKCDDVTASMTNTVSLFNTLTHSGPFNAMHVLARVEGQIDQISRLISKMDQESKATDVSFVPPSQSFEDHVSSFSLGQIVTQFGSSEMTIPNPGGASPEAAGIGENLSTLSIDSRSTVGSNLALSGQAALGGSSQSLDSRVSEPGNVSCATANTADRGDGREGTTAGYPSAPPLEKVSDFYPAPPDYNSIVQGKGHMNYAYSSPPPLCPPAPTGYSPSPLPSAPPASGMGPPSPADWYDKSPVLAEAYQQSVCQEFTCHPLMVFSGNMPSETRIGGICGAARMNHKNRAAFADRFNHSVKIVDLHQAQMVGYLHLKDLEPWDITFVPDGPNLVVTCPASNYLLFICPEARQLKIGFYYRTRYAYPTVAHLKEDLFVGGVCTPFGSPAVHVFNVKGTVLQQILPGEFSYPRTIFTNYTGSQIIVSDRKSNAVVLVTAEGQLVCRYKAAPSPKGVAVSELTGLMHVLDGKFCRLHLLDTAGRCVATSKLEGCRDPRTVVVVSTSSSHFPNKELTVIVDGSNALHVMMLGDSSVEYSLGEGGFSSPVQSTV